MKQSRPPATSAPVGAAAPLFPPALRILLGLAAAVIALAGVSYARELIGPLAIGAVIVIICHPVRFPLERWGWPRWAATTGVIVVGYLILAVMALLLTFAGVEFARLVADYEEQLQQAAENFVALLQSIGVAGEAADAGASVMKPEALIGFATSLGGTVLNVLTALFFILGYVIFMAADGARYTRAEAAFGRGIRPTVRRFQVYNSGVRRYYVVNATFGAIVAVIDGLALWALGVPAPAVWAILALVVGGWPLALAVVAVYSVVNVTLQVLVQPKFVSDAVNLSLTLSFFAVIFWTFIIGPVGAILSIPLTLLVRALILESDPGATWLRWLSGDHEVAPLQPGAAADPD